MTRVELLSRVLSETKVTNGNWPSSTMNYVAAKAQANPHVSPAQSQGFSSESTTWKQPLGENSTKRKLNDDQYKQKMKLHKASIKESVMKLNNIQQSLVQISKGLSAISCF
ncbi:hypothetical protein VP01_677g7 [Puccinia sorghi]|uniref:No apical meristem-associated C-terminal domain-containing protein n=1 Tax=Puccinia sorghi TaxID=27349 RepID=A0A0L6UEL2_9BASI|nr:hypothetical protein VP01_677g7 [Puccinia sorghi]